MRRNDSFFSILTTLFLLIVFLFPTLSQAHNGGRDELGGHFRSSDCVYMLHDPTNLAKSAKTIDELIALIKKYNSNETCKAGLAASKVDLEGYTFPSGTSSEDQKETVNTQAPTLSTSTPSGQLKIGETYSATLEKCVDGDTANFNINGTVYKTRFLYIDTPESTNQVEPYGKEASEYTCSFLKQGKITIETDGNTLFDKYDRLLAWVFVDDKLHQEEITKSGLVEDFYDYGDYKYEQRIVEAMSFAKANYLGIYSANKPVSSETKTTKNKDVTTSEKVTDTKEPTADTNNDHEDAEVALEVEDNEENHDGDDYGIGLGMIALLIAIVFFSFLLLSRK